MYAKLFESMLRSSIWAADKETRILWISMIAAADREGFVFGSLDGLSRLANLTLDETATAIEKLLAPDPHSSDLVENPENEGRRLERVSRGWRIVNYGYYRELQNGADRREKARLKKSAQRNRRRLEQTTAARGGTNVPQLSPMSPKVPPSGASSLSSLKSPPSVQVFSPQQGELASAPPPPRSPKLRTAGARKDRPSSPDEVRTYWTEENLAGDAAQFFDHFEANGWKQGRGALKDWRAAARNWSRRESNFAPPLTRSTFDDYPDPPNFSKGSR